MPQHPLHSRVVALRKQQRTIREIADALHIAPKTIRGILGKEPGYAGPCRPGAKVSDKVGHMLKTQVDAMLDGGMLIKLIAHNCGVSEKSIYAYKKKRAANSPKSPDPALAPTE